MKIVLLGFLTFTLMFGGLLSCNQDEENPSYSETGNSSGATQGDTEQAYDDSSLAEATLYLVGDSTVCDYTKTDGTLTDSTYFYPRYGYGTQFYVNLSKKITVKNLALSGYSSKSFLLHENYNTLKQSIKAGDFLVIGFGHNDQKSDDSSRFSDARQSTETEGSFKYNLYNYYVKMALDKGATPILCSPIVRANSSNDYTGSHAHVTAVGDYGKAVVELGSEKNVQVVDLTTLTKNLYTSLGYAKALYFHAVPSGNEDKTPKFSSVDTTHINIYGAKMVSYLFAKTIKESSSSLQPYISQTYEPTQEKDLVVNPAWKYVAYTAVDWSSYAPAENLKTLTSGWYGTGFGDTGGDPATVSNGYYATETSAGVFKVGQTGTGSPKGKIASSSEGFAFCFVPISVSRNFTLTASAKVTVAVATKQAGFGLMLRDDCYKPTNDKSILSNSVSAGFLTTDSSMSINFSRASKSLVLSSNTVSSLYEVGDTTQFTIKRLGQVVTVTTVYKGETYTNTYTDFDFVAVDADYFYVGMFGTRGTEVEFTEMVFTDDGESQGA